MMVTTRIAKRAITILPTNRSRLSNSSAHESHTGAVNFTDWWRLNRMKYPYRYADVSRVCVTLLERHREHSCWLNLFGIVLVLKYIWIGSSNCLANRGQRPPGRADFVHRGLISPVTGNCRFPGGGAREMLRNVRGVRGGDTPFRQT